MTKYKINIENNSNKGDIVINIPEKIRTNIALIIG